VLVVDVLITVQLLTTGVVSLPERIMSSLLFTQFGCQGYTLSRLLGEDDSMDSLVG
jgi:hypothetical protein